MKASWKAGVFAGLVLPTSMMILAACGGSGDGAETAAVDADPAMVEAAEAREEGFKSLGRNFKTIKDNMDAGNAASDAALAAIDEVEVLADDLPNWFPEGSAPETGTDTEALPAIWEEPDAFQAKVSDFQAAVTELGAAGESGDAAAISAAFGNVGKTCGSCHDDFREDD